MKSARLCSILTGCLLSLCLLLSLRSVAHSWLQIPRIGNFFQPKLKPPLISSIFKKGIVIPRRARARQITTRCSPQNVTSLKLYLNNGGGVDADESYAIWPNMSVKTLRRELNKFDPRELTFVLIHGFMSCLNVQRIAFPNRLKHAITRLYRKANIFYVDWTHRSFNPGRYLAVVDQVPLVALEVYDSLKLIQEAFPSFDRTNITIIGHSLGAHVAGSLGRIMNGSLSAIIGLDPANPSYVHKDPMLKLTSDDAKYVVAIHTDNFYGTPFNVADRDFFFNGGDKQPGCGTSACDHREAPLLLMPDMGHCQLVAYHCESHESFRAGLCGFCRSKADDCALAGMEWQYANEILSNLRPTKSNKTKGTKQIEWNLEPLGTRYHIITSQNEPKCMFLYQVVVEFKEPPAVDWALSVTFMSKKDRFLRRNVESIGIHDMLPTHSKKLTTFTTRNSTRELSGELVHTALLSFDSRSDFWPVMPINFWDDERIEVKVFDLSQQSVSIYFNFMSSINYAERAKYSSAFQFAK